MRRGEIRIVNLSPTPGAESAQTRPAVIVSNDGANTTAARLWHGAVTVVPITSNTERIHPFQVLLIADDTGLGRDSKAQAEQVRSISVERVGRLIGQIPFDQMAQVDNALRLHLAL
ncbi:type II toxin-antitoxin system PemK/MazF family toxin [Candidatus Poriferisocius sp.]|uniref:type II toxin-antitoxin system PemK/MazF family toxin n=1 Tax=Candidatus Poriferisocius sp. TaxID=3101276 RepID=UPI003B51A498